MAEIFPMGSKDKDGVDDEMSSLLGEVHQGWNKVEVPPQSDQGGYQYVR